MKTLFSDVEGSWSRLLHTHLCDCEIDDEISRQWTPIFLSQLLFVSFESC